MAQAYRPTFVKQLDGSAYAGFNCNCAVAAMLLDRMTKGKETTTGAKIRSLMGITTPATTPEEADAALNKGWKVDVLTGRFPVAEMDEHLVKGEGLSVVVIYAPIAKAGRAYSGQESGFTGFHELLVNEKHPTADEYLIYDPLADGRRATVAKSPIWYPGSLLRLAIAEANVGAHKGSLWGSYTIPAFATATPPAPAPVVILRYGGTLSRRGIYRTVRPGHFRSEPSVNAAVVRTVPAGFTFHARQSTAKGTSVHGTKVWLGDATGRVWITINNCEVVK